VTSIKFHIALCSIEVLSLISFVLSSQVWEGGPLFDFSGSFVGMNLFSSTEGSFFMPSNIIIEWLGQLRISQERNAFLSWVKYLKMVRYVFKCFYLLIYVCPCSYTLSYPFAHCCVRFGGLVKQCMSLGGIPQYFCMCQAMYEVQWIYNILNSFFLLFAFS
jgi:hypothetical protein